MLYKLMVFYFVRASFSQVGRAFAVDATIVGSNLLSGPIIDGCFFTHINQCNVTNITKAVVCIILSMGWCI